MHAQRDWLADEFEQNRAHLKAVAYRMLGSASEAEDAVQESWIRLSRTGTDDVQNLGGWLTTVVARVCLDMLRSRKSRREEPLEDDVPHAVVESPEHEAMLADSVGPALLLVLETLAPAERIAFVLHDLFGVPFEEIATIVGRSPTAARQLASRARRRVQGAGSESGDVVAQAEARAARQRQIVEAFLAASRQGNFEALLAVLDPDVVLRADAAWQRTFGAGAARKGISEQRGVTAVAGMFSGGAQAAEVALLDGLAAMVWAPGGQARVAFEFTIEGDRIVAINLIADPERLKNVELLAN